MARLLSLYAMVGSLIMAPLALGATGNGAFAIKGVGLMSCAQYVQDSSDPKLTYVVAGCKPWNRSVFVDVISRFDGNWVFIADRSELTIERLRELDPRYVFFLHWSWLVPAEITEAFECVGFHMTDVP